MHIKRLIPFSVPLGDGKAYKPKKFHNRNRYMTIAFIHYFQMVLLLELIIYLKPIFQHAYERYMFVFNVTIFINLF